MAEKKTIGSGLCAKALARVKEGKSFKGQWGVGEHLALHRYMAVDALADADALMKSHNAKPENANAKLDFAKAFNMTLRKAYDADPELAYASNFQKLLIKAGEISLVGDYE